MNRNRSTIRNWVVAAVVAGGLWVGVPAARAHDGPGAHDPVAVLKAGQEMARAATHLWKALTPEQQKQMGFEFKDPERVNWIFVPHERKGLPWKEMTPAQRELGHALLATGLSQKGYVRAETIMSLEQVLDEMEQGKGQFKRDPERYFFSVFGKPESVGDKDAKEPWGWRVEGHHLSINLTIAGGKGVVGGPVFMGTNPAEVREGPRKGLRLLAEEEDMGRALVKALTDDQRKKAVFSADAPKDIITSNNRTGKRLEPAGVGAGELSAEQRKQLMDLVALYAGRLRSELAAEDLARIEKAGADKVSFAWAGGTEPNQPHYYRIQGPTFLVEYDDTQNNANHIHTVWRDLENDFGDDLLKAHYEADHK